MNFGLAINSRESKIDKNANIITGIKYCCFCIGNPTSFEHKNRKTKNFFFYTIINEALKINRVPIL